MTDFDPYLDAAALSALGIADWPFGYRDRVRFSELDPLNHVNNAAYLSWFETARIGYLLRYGLSGMTHSEADPQIVVRRQLVDYLAPVLFGETYIVAMRSTRIKPSSLVMDYAVYVDGRIRATGETVIVSLTPDGRARQPFRPEAVRLMAERDSAEIMTP
jgi:acyl-CoA thioester hydrolase